MSDAHKRSDYHEHVGYLFIYDELVAPDVGLRRWAADELPGVESVYGYLEGCQRQANAAHNNFSRERDSNHYVDRGSNQRPDIAIASFTIAPAAAAKVSGVAVPVTPSLLTAFGRHKIDYELSPDCAGDFSEFLDGWPLWTLLATDNARRIFTAGQERNLVYLPDEYLNEVENAFAQISKQARSDFTRTTIPLACPIRQMHSHRPIIL